MSVIRHHTSLRRPDGFTLMPTQLNPPYDLNGNAYGDWW
jgi:hypothetical protein